MEDSSEAYHLKTTGCTIKTIVTQLGESNTGNREK